MFKILKSKQFLRSLFACNCPRNTLLFIPKCKNNQISYTNHNRDKTFEYSIINLTRYFSSIGVNIEENTIVPDQNLKPVLSVSKGGKIYEENESLFYHSVMQNLERYSGSIYKTDSFFTKKYVLNDVEFSKLTGDEAFEGSSSHNVAVAFISLGVYSSLNLNLTLDDDRFNKLAAAFVEKCDSFSDDLLIDCLIAVTFWPKSSHVKAHNFLKIWKSLDDVCFRRTPNWTVDKMLFIMDLWFHTRLPRLSNFMYKGLIKISNKCGRLTATQMIQALFYMSCLRKVPEDASLSSFEYYIQQYITHLTIEEIGIFAAAFFKTQTMVYNQKILLYMMQRVAEELNTIPEITLSAISKVLRLSVQPDLAFSANELVKRIVEQRMDSLNLLSSIQVMHICSRVQFFNEEGITKLAEKFYKDPSVARLKDLERLTYLLSLFDFIPSSTPDILDVILRLMDLPEHMSKERQFLLAKTALLYYLTLFKVFPEHHIRRILDEEAIKNDYASRFIINSQVLKIDYNRVLEGPPGSEHLLSPKLREYLARRYSNFIPERERVNQTYFDRTFIEVWDEISQLLGGEQYTHVTHTLPHFPRADILFRLDSAGKPVPIPEEFRSLPAFDDVKRPEGEGWRCVMLGARNMYMHNSSRLLGEQLAKLRQLRLLGYTPIVIPVHYWRKEENKADYLKLKFFMYVMYCQILFLVMFMINFMLFSLIIR